MSYGYGPHGTISDMTNYRLAEPLTEEAKTALAEYHPVLQQLLFSRGICDKATAESFLDPQYTDTHDPFLLHDMQRAVERILEAIQSNEKIAIFSDYDCDGIPGAVILHDFFKVIGHEEFTNYIPHRHYEGFGFSEQAAKKLADEGVKLIVTIDCGTTNHEAVRVAAKCGVDVIITDHHEPKQSDGSDDLPLAVAVVNPKVGDSYPFTGLCGAGVVFKLVQALIAAGKDQNQFTLTDGWEKWWLDMVGIATVADMVPLTGENRILAHYGLQVLRKSRRPGLQQLLRKQRVNQRYLTEDDIGFTIGPRINAASRMDTPEDAFTLLSTTDEGEAGAQVAHLEKLNNERRGQVAAMTKEIHKRLKEMDEVPPVLVLGNPDWRPALVGLAAGKLAEEHNRPVFLWGRDGNNTYKGSCRSNGTVSVVKLMEAISDNLSEHGGHHQSGGFSVKDEHIHTFSTSMNKAYDQLGESALIEQTTVADLSLALDQIDYPSVAAQKQLAPFGVENPKPLYEITDAVLGEVSIFGKTKEHTKLLFNTDGAINEAIAFFRLPDQFTITPEPGAKLTLLAHIEESFFMGRKQTRFRIVDIV